MAQKSLGSRGSDQRPLRCFHLSEPTITYRFSLNAKYETTEQIDLFFIWLITYRRTIFRTFDPCVPFLLLRDWKVSVYDKVKALLSVLTLKLGTPHRSGPIGPMTPVIHDPHGAFLTVPICIYRNPLASVVSPHTKV